MGSSYSCCKTCACPQQKDTAPGRRQILSEKGIDRYLQDYPHDAHKNVKVTTQYVEKPSGQLAHCKLFEPKNPSDAKGMICYAIGFGDHVDWNNHDTGCVYADLGFIVFMVEYNGHGRSDGDYTVILDFERDLVDETIWMFLQAIDRHIKPHPVYSKSIDEKNNYFLGGKSMGGAVSILIALKLQKQKFNPFKGIVLVAPMVGIAETVKPPPCVLWCLQNCLLRCCKYAKLVENKVEDNLTENEDIQRRWDANPISYDQPIPLCTANAMLMTASSIQERAKELRMPLMICHGETDIVTDCELSKAFYEECGCDEQDKTLNVYQGKGHMLYEEAPEVFSETVDWMSSRMTTTGQRGNDQQNNTAELSPAGNASAIKVIYSESDD